MHTRKDCCKRSEWRTNEKRFTTMMNFLISVVNLVVGYVNRKWVSPSPTSCATCAGPCRVFGAHAHA